MIVCQTLRICSRFEDAMKHSCETTSTFWSISGNVNIYILISWKTSGQKGTTETTQTISWKDRCRKNKVRNRYSVVRKSVKSGPRPSIKLSHYVFMSSQLVSLAISGLITGPCWFSVIRHLTHSRKPRNVKKVIIIHIYLYWISDYTTKSEV